MLLSTIFSMNFIIKIRFIILKNLNNVRLHFLDTYELVISFIKFNRNNSSQNSWIINLSFRERMKLKDEDSGE